MSFLRVQNGRLVDGGGKPVRLRGVNLGNWLMLEGYMLAGPNEPERSIRQGLARRVGARGARQFFQQYQKSYIQAADLARIKSWGFNLVRVPFNARLLAGGDGLYSQNGWERLTWLVRQCGKAGLRCLLDLHAAPGAQNADWHSDSQGRALLWESGKFQEQTVDLWAAMADRFKNEPAVAGYDLLNEPNTNKTRALNALYRRCARAIRDTGDRHLLFLEGTEWSTVFSTLDDIDDPQIVYSPHFYKPHPFTFNWALDTVYPGRVDGVLWNKKKLRMEMERHARWARRRGAPVLLGEFGVNTRCPACHAETRWVRDLVDVCESLGFHWTYWSYKVVSTHMHPSGLLRFPQNPSWLKREGVAIGWENLPQLSPAGRRQFLREMDSKNFTVDTPILKILRSPLTERNN